MKSKNRWRGLFAGLLSLCMAVSFCPVQSRAAEGDAYTYSVTFYAGNHGHFGGNAGVDVYPGAPGVRTENRGSTLVVSGLPYGSRVSINAQRTTELDTEKYYVRGVRKSGTDNSEAQVGEPSFEVTADQDYVVAYGIRGNLVEYTVNYQDGNGNTLRESETYRGNAGDYMVVAYLYIEGYQPQAYNLGRTLSDNAAQNVFTFVYTPVRTGGGGTGGGGAEPAPAPGGGETPPAAEAVTPPAAEAVPAPGAPAAAEAGGADAPGGEAGVPGGAPGVEVPDEDVPQTDEPEEFRNLDDEEVPLAGAEDDSESSENNRNIMGAAVIAGIGGAALIGLLIFWLKRRKKNQEEDEERDNT